MELKVWCEGIPRVVCGASATTTCQDVVFALAHATGQVGRFILIEKWRHCERVLAPNDRPLASLLKFGEYAADVTFVMKKSGEVSTASSNSNSAQNNGGKVNNGTGGGGGNQRTTLLLNSGGGKKPSDSELLHHQQQRKVLQNSGDQNVPPSQSQPQLQSVMSTSKSAGALSAYQNNNSNYSATLPHRGHRPEPFVRSISFHKPAELQLANGGEVILTSSTSHHPNHSHHHQHTYSMSNSNRSGVNYVPVSGVNGRTGVFHPQQQEAKHEPIYSTKAGAQNNSSRPPQPPPYQEAITKSSLFNGGNNSNSNSNSNPSSNGIYGYIGGNTAKQQQQQLNSSQQQQQQQQQQTNGLVYQQQQHYQNKQQQQQQPTPLHEHQRMNMMNSNGGTSKNHHLTKNHLSYLQQETRSIIDAQQQTIKKQEKDMVTIDQELNAVQRRLSANERVVAQYRAEMDYLHEIWLDQEALLGRLEAENLEEELERLITEAKAYEDELAEVRSRLSTCEADIARSREQISSLMVQVDEAAKAKDKERKKEEDKSENEQQQQAKLYSSLQKSILEKTKEIESQKLDLNLLCASIERLDQTIQDKNGIIDQLVVEIKDANVEGLSLSGALKGSSAGDGLTVRLDESHPQNQKSQQSSNHQMLMQNPMNSTTSANSSSTRKISVLPSELGNTVPTKKNPDGIWV